MAMLKHLALDCSHSMAPAPDGETFGPSSIPDYMSPILGAAEAEVVHPMVQVAADNLTITLTASAPRIDFDNTLKEMLDRARSFRQAFPPERIPAGNHDHPIGPKTINVYWDWGSPLMRYGTAQCHLCDVTWGFDVDLVSRATCWCCGRSEDRPQG